MVGAPGWRGMLLLDAAIAAIPPREVPDADERSAAQPSRMPLGFAPVNRRRRPRARHIPSRRFEVRPVSALGPVMVSARICHCRRTGDKV